jgi:hypothetical protein
VPLSQLGSGKAGVDLSGSAPYTAGRFSGTVTSTLRLHFGRAVRFQSKGGEDRSGPSPRRRFRTVRVRVVRVHAVYRITHFGGKLSESFGGLTEPPCEDLDSCGVSGTASWAIQSSGGALSVSGESFARRSDHGFGGALAAITRDDAAYGEVRQPRFFGTTTAEVKRPDGAPCHDTARVAAPGIDINIFLGRVVLGVGRDDVPDTDTDILRTGCPGPRDYDVLQGFSFARGSMPLSRLTKRKFQLTMSGGGPFGGATYDGSNTGRFTIRLQRRSVRFKFRTIKIKVPR